MSPKAPSSARAAPFTEFTAFPNVLLDTLMPTLKDTEWRLLCVIVRQTIGWSEGNGQRKQRDWLTQRQLSARTGRNSAALSAAIDTLVCRSLIHTWTEAGELLMTRQERRRYQGRLYFGLCHETVQTLLTKPLKSELHKANRTKENKDQREIRVKRKIGSRSEPSIDPQVIYSGWQQAAQITSTRYFASHNDLSE